MADTDALRAEEQVLRLRPHAARLAAPLLVLLGCLAVLGFALARTSGPARAAVALALLAVVLRWSVVPWLRWLTTAVELTPTRVTVHRGLLRRRSHELSLWRVTDLTVERTVRQRLLGSGTVVLATAAGDVVLPDLPGVRGVAAQLRDDVERVRPDDDTR